jgi:hypothetical protein
VGQVKRTHPIISLAVQTGKSKSETGDSKLENGKWKMENGN